MTLAWDFLTHMIPWLVGLTPLVAAAALFPGILLRIVSWCWPHDSPDRLELLSNYQYLESRKERLEFVAEATERAIIEAVPRRIGWLLYEVGSILVVAFAQLTCNHDLAEDILENLDGSLETRRLWGRLPQVQLLRAVERGRDLHLSRPVREAALEYGLDWRIEVPISIEKGYTYEVEFRVDDRPFRRGPIRVERVRIRPSRESDLAAEPSGGFRGVFIDGLDHIVDRAFARSIDEKRQRLMVERADWVCVLDELRTSGTRAPLPAAEMEKRLQALDRYLDALRPLADPPR